MNAKSNQVVDQVLSLDGRLARVLRLIDSQAQKPSFLPLISVFPLVGYLVPLLPTQLLLVSLSLLHQARWLSIALSFLLATSIGALITSLLIQKVGGGFGETLVSKNSSLRQISAFISAYGLWAIAILALLPWPPRSAVLVCAAVGLNPVAIALTVLVGRTAPTLLIAWLSAHAPNILRRVQRFDIVLDHIHELREKRSSQLTEPQRQT